MELESPLSLTEAIYAIAVDQDDVDTTNIIDKVRRAQAVVLDYAGGDAEALHTLRSPDEVDNILIMITRNGTVDIFA
ncbi:hypothetical protein [Microbacterium sp. NPDC091662]|uniref:hypothetical protein n=1 Tax=Microbacterium sp. NPDC091662 TaxID=3364211 RepID=UPI00382409D2